MSLQNTLLVINDLSIEYPGNIHQPCIAAVTDFNLNLNQGEIGCLLGCSGSGKSTVLRSICGFEKLKKGTILLRQQIVSSLKVHTPVHLRKIGMVFQDFGLFPHLNVLQNITLGILHLSGKSKIHQAHRWLEKVALSEKANAYPHELSGGQQQRVALARAMAPEPDLILLDEPFSSIDLNLRKQLANDLQILIKQTGKTALIVTHDQLEAFSIADKVGVMNHGQLLQWDTPLGVCQSPRNRFIATFMGQNFFLSGIVIADQRIQTEVGEFSLDDRYRIDLGKTVEILFNFNDLTLDNQSSIKTRMVSRLFRGVDFLYQLELISNPKLKLYLSSNQFFEVGKSIGICLPKKPVVAFECYPKR
jgi:iron(III) transport system ATP-binding protein